ncbi:MAG: hypothetical protein PUP46_02675 [Endozoicomonas sp. (ex Botrylloides leachii)]|nr:hypothetical protein [Endozoicomonas sp. (ex Botrylloides leachii)]
MKKLFNTNNLKSSITTTALLWFFCLILLGISGFEYWQISTVRSELHQTRTELNSASSLLQSITGEVSATGASLSKKNSAIHSELKTVNHEIRKLWDLANKRNKKAIKTHDVRLDKLENKTGQLEGEVNKATVTAQSVKSIEKNLQASLQKLTTQQLNSGTEVLGILNSLKERVNALEIKAKDQTKWQADLEKSIDDFRLYVNRKLLQVENSVRALQQPAKQGL